MKSMKSVKSWDFYKKLPTCELGTGRSSARQAGTLALQPACSRKCLVAARSDLLESSVSGGWISLLATFLMVFLCLTVRKDLLRHSVSTALCQRRAQRMHTHAYACHGVVLITSCTACRSCAPF